MLRLLHLSGIFPQIIDLPRQRLMFRDLDLEELHGDPRFFLDPSRRQQVGIALLVFAVAEVVGFHQAFLNQCLDAIVHPPKADAQIPGQFALADLRIGFQTFQNFVAVFVA